MLTGDGVNQCQSSLSWWIAFIITFVGVHTTVWPGYNQSWGESSVRDEMTHDWTSIVAMTGRRSLTIGFNHVILCVYFRPVQNYFLWSWLCYDCTKLSRSSCNQEAVDITSTHYYQFSQNHRGLSSWLLHPFQLNLCLPLISSAAAAAAAAAAATATVIANTTTTASLWTMQIW